MELFNELVIFEMANNHQGNLEHARSIIQMLGDLAKKYNVKAAVKFQYRNLETFIRPDYIGREDIKYVKRFESTKLSFSQFSSLVELVKQYNMIPMSTPFDEASVDWIVKQGLQIIKVASASSMDWPLLEKIASVKKPTIISTGGKTIEDIDKIYNFMKHRNVDFALLHCVSEYPAPDEDLQLNFIDKMKKRFNDIQIGYSGHESPSDNIISTIALAKGATILERHVGIPLDDIPLNKYSLNPQQIESWLQSIMRTRQLCNLKAIGDKYVGKDEMESLLALSRGVFANSDIRIGEKLTRDNVFFAFPCDEGQLKSGDFSTNLTASKNYYKNDAIIEKKILSNIHIARDVIHSAKGLVNEAGIHLGGEFTVELSHHYGIENFHNIGATIVNLINREYCKKIIIMLPGQKHPAHHHKKKEETFQLLSGDLNLIIDGQLLKLIPGDIQLVKRNQVHSFDSKSGAIFEEISTTHLIGDSYYEDPSIAEQDIIVRKTFVENW